jgi:predicted nucleotidyltransferase
MGWSYEELLPRAKTVRVAGLEVRVLDLAAVIESKEEAGRDKDKAMLPVLRRTLEVRRAEPE